MIRFPSVDEVIRMNERLAEVVGGEAGVRDDDLLSAVLLGARISRSGNEAHAVTCFNRAAVLFHHIVTSRPFMALNGATGLGVALLYLRRYSHEVALAEGQAMALVDGARSGSMDPRRIASLFELRATVKGAPDAG